jgi:hypothetical protein
MGAAVAAGFQMDGPMNAPSARGKYGVARFMCLLVDGESFATERKHFGHKWHTFELPVAVQGPEDLFFATNFDPIADSQFPSQSDSPL